MSDTHGMDGRARDASATGTDTSRPGFMAALGARLSASPQLRNRLFGFAFLSLVFYVGIFAFAAPIMAAYSDGGFPAALIPVTIAFCASLIHGTFASYLWEAVGITAQQKTRAPDDDNEQEKGSR